MADPFRGQSVKREDPAVDWTLITPNDGADLAQRPRKLFIAATGNLVIRGNSGQSLTLTGLAANTQLNLSPLRVMATGTTATVWGLY